MSEDQEPHDEDPPENESKGIYSSYIYHEPQSIEEIEKDLHDKIESVFGEVEDITEIIGSTTFPHIDPNLVEKLQRTMYGNLFSSETKTDIDQLEPIVDIPEDFTIDKQIPEDYIRRFYDREIADTYGSSDIVFVDEDSMITSAPKPTWEKSPMTEVRETSEELLDVLSDHYATDIDRDIFSIFDDIKDTIEQNRDVFSVDEHYTKPWFDDFISEETREVAGILKYISEFAEDYEELARQYLSARFRLMKSENIKHSVVKYIETYKSEIDDIRERFDEIRDQRYIERMREYQDKHVAKGLKTEPIEYLPLDKKSMEKEYNKILEEEIEFATRLFQLDKIKVKGYVDDPSVKTVEELLREIPQLKLRDLTSKERRETEFISAGYISNNITETGVGYSRGHYVLFTPTLEDAEGSNLMKPINMFIDTTANIASVRKTLRHELVHSINNLVTRGNTSIEGLKATLLYGGKKSGLSKYFYDIREKLEFLAITVEHMTDSFDPDDSDPKIKELFENISKMIGTKPSTEALEKIHDLMQYIDDFLDSVKGVRKKIEDVHFKKSTHGKEMIDQLRLSEGAPSTITKDTYTATEPAIRSRATFHANRSDIMEVEGYSLVTTPSTMIDRIMDLDQLASQHTIRSYKRKFFSQLVFMDTFMEDLETVDTMEKALKDPDTLEYMKYNRFTIPSIRKMSGGSSTDTEESGEDEPVDSEDTTDEPVDDQTTVTPTPTPPSPPPPNDPPPMASPPGDSGPDGEPSSVTTTVTDIFTVHRPTPLTVSLSRRVILLNEIDLPKLFNFHERMEKMLSTKVCTR